MNLFLGLPRQTSQKTVLPSGLHAFSRNFPIRGASVAATTRLTHILLVPVDLFIITRQTLVPYIYTTVVAYRLERCFHRSAYDHIRESAKTSMTERTFSMSFIRNHLKVPTGGYIGQKPTTNGPRRLLKKVCRRFIVRTMMKISS